MRSINLLSKDLSSLKVLTLLFIFINSALWLPAIFIPFWGDDYYFLMQAKEARLSEASWLLPFMSESSTGFWRPLSMDTAWRIIETYLKGDPIKSHIFSFFIWLISIYQIYLLSFTIANALGWNRPRFYSIVVSCLYSFSAIHFLVLHWVAAINSSFLVIFICLSLTFWVSLATSQSTRLPYYLVGPFLQSMALFCKESAILLPTLMLCTSLFVGKNLNSRQFKMWLMCVVLCIVWYHFFGIFTHHRDNAYELKFGFNIVQNTAGLMAWMLNVPRESIRLIYEGQTLLAIVWITPIVICMTIFVVIATRGLQKNAPGLQWLSVVGFIVTAYAPYFFLSKQSYEYYAAIAFILPAVFLARGLVVENRVTLGLGVFALASLISIQGSRLLEYPSLIGRAVWGEAQLNWLSTQQIAPPLVVNVKNEHQFYAIGVKGLAWRLNIPENQIVLSDNCAFEKQKCLSQEGNGKFFWVENR